MMRIPALGWKLAGCVIALAGCSSPPVAIEPAPTISVALDAAKKLNDVSAKRTNRVVLVFPSNERPDARWQISFHDTRYLELLSDIAPGRSPTDGATASFLALKAGRTRLRFVLLPTASRREVEPLDQQEIILTIE